jgi:release factor glutamine methyltransferase
VSELKLGEYLRFAEQELALGPHPGRAHRDAEILLCHLLAEDRVWLLTHRDANLNRQQSEFFEQLVDRRLAGEPIQYILGETEFYRLKFQVTPDVLIPRPETEHLVEKALELAPLFTKPRIVDVGTGSGAIAIALAHELPNATVIATDVSAATLTVARANAEKNCGAQRVSFIEGDLLVPVTGKQFDFVVSNPPYVPETDRESLAVEVREFEPARALFAGVDGLAVYRRLIPQAFAALASGGFVLLEIGHGQKPALQALLAEAGFANIEFTLDLQGIPRVACAKRK